MDDFGVHRFHQDEQIFVLNVVNAPWIASETSRTSGFDGPSRDPLGLLADLLALLNGMAFAPLQGHRNQQHGSLSVDVHRYAHFVSMTSMLQNVQLDDLSRMELIEFFVNLYNVLALHVFLATDRLSRMVAVHPYGVFPFTFMYAYRIGCGESQLTLTLDDIRHGLLRGNQRVPGWLFRVLNSSDDSGGGDGRAALQLMERMLPVDYRIHFCLSDVYLFYRDPAMYPLVTAYITAEGMGHRTQQQLGLTVRVDTWRNEILLPPIFNWWERDFGRDVGEVVTNLIRVSEGQLRKLLLRAAAYQVMNAGTGASGGSGNLGLRILPFPPHVVASGSLSASSSSLSTSAVGEGDGAGQQPHHYYYHHYQQHQHQQQEQQQEQQQQHMLMMSMLEESLGCLL